MCQGSIKLTGHTNTKHTANCVHNTNNNYNILNYTTKPTPIKTGNVLTYDYAIVQ